ncbi:hypothetical protein ACX40Y_15935 [Sphingomonas sp. RS6]
MTPLGPVHVRMTGVVRGDEKGPGVASINAPTAADATAALHRAARVNGADQILQVSSDYRRAAIAGGAAVTQWRIEVQAWGVAVAQVDPSTSEDSLREDAERKAEEAKRVADEDARTEAAKTAADDTGTLPDGPEADAAPTSPDAIAPAPADVAPAIDPVAAPTVVAAATPVAGPDTAPLPPADTGN